MRRGREHFQLDLVEIRTILKANLQGLSIQEIARMIGANRNSVAKYLESLYMQGSVDLRKHGNAKVYIPASRYQIETLQRLCTDGLLILNHELSIVYCNSKLYGHLGTLPDALIGSPFEDLISTFRAKDQIMTLTIAAVRGKEDTIRIASTWKPECHNMQLDLLPVVFSNGHPGAGVIFKGLSEENSDRYSEVRSIDLESKLLEQLVEVYCRLSPDYTIIEVNETFCRMNGQCREELIGSRFSLMVPDDDWKNVLGALLALTPLVPLVTIEHRILTEERLVRWVHWKYQAKYSLDGVLIEYLCSGLHITELKKIEECLEHFRTHLEGITRSRDGLLREVNRRETVEQQPHLTQFGIDTVPDMIRWPDKNDTIARIDQEGMKNVRDVTREQLTTCIRRKDLKRSQVGEHEFPVLVIKGGPRVERSMRRVHSTPVPAEMMIDHTSCEAKEYACFSIQDPGAQKRYETTFWVEKRRRLMTENVRDIIFRVSLLPEVGIDFITPSIERLTGYSPQQFYTQPSLIRQILNEQDYSILLSFVNAPGLSDDLVAVKVRRHDSSWTWIEISVVLIRDGRGCVTAVEGIGHDVSTWN